MKRLLLFLFLTSSLYATDYSPWFSPLWEFQGRLSSSYGRVSKVQSPKGDFRAPSNNITVAPSLALTPWPYWSAEIELYLSTSHDIPCSYEAIWGTLRYQWLDESCGDPLTLVAGATLSLPGGRYVHSFNYLYHGEINAEWHLTAGKGWSECCSAWFLAGWGIANRGSGWLHALGVVEFCGWGLFSESFIGFGGGDILPDRPFKGYASIAHRSLDIGAFVDLPIFYFGELTFLGWYNLYARNFTKHDFGCAVTLLIPFGL